MAGRNRNTFLKRQKEIERVRKAREKMDRRQGKVSRDPDQAPMRAPVEAGAEAEGEDGTVLEAGADVGAEAGDDSGVEVGASGATADR